MAYGKRSPLPKLKNTNAIDDVKSALKNKDIKITGAMGSKLRAEQYKEKGWAMDNTISSDQGGTYKRPTAPTGKFGSDLRKREYEANNWGGDATTKGNMPGSNNVKPGTGGPSTTSGTGGPNTNVTGGPSTTSGPNTADSSTFKKFNPFNQFTPAAETLTNRVKSGGSFKFGGKSYAEQAMDNLMGRNSSTGAYTSVFENAPGGAKTGNTGFTDSMKFNNAVASAKQTATGGTGIETGSTDAKATKKQKYSTEDKSGKQRRRAERANRYNTLAKKAFDAGDTQEANRLIREEADVSKKIDRTKKRRDEKREKRLAKAQAKVKKYTK